MDRRWSSPAATAAMNLPNDLRDRLMAASGAALPTSADIDRIDASCRRLADASGAFLVALKQLLRAGILLIERAHPDGPMTNSDGVLDEGTHVMLIEMVERIPDLLTRWLEQVAGPQ